VNEYYQNWQWHLFQLNIFKLETCAVCINKHKSYAKLLRQFLGGQIMDNISIKISQLKNQSTYFLFINSNLCLSLRVNITLM